MASSSSSFVIIGLLFSVILVSSSPTKTDHLYLIISFDGFRYDYLDMVKAKGRETPNFDRIIASGVRAQYMKPAFPTTTWPNHWSIATGMHVESHGVVANTYYDYKLGALYDSPDTPDAKWYENGTGNAGGEPIWVTFEKAGYKTGCAVWPASTTPIHGILPSHYLAQDNANISMKARVDAVIEWFTLKKDPATLAMLYFDEPDDTGHNFGPSSQELENVIVELDGVMGYLLEQLTHKLLIHKVNMVIMSDHGMDDLIETYKLDEYVDPSLYMPPLSGDTAVHMFMHTPGNDEALAQALKTIPHAQYYRQEDLPREYFYTYNERILPHILISEDGYGTCCSNGSKPPTGVAGHGYNNSHPNMWPIFMAHGPAFKAKYVSPAFNNIDIYPLMCHLIGIEPPPNNGSLDNIRHILVYDWLSTREHRTSSKAKQTVVKASKSIAGLILMLGLAGFVTLVYFTVYKKGQYRRNRATSQDLAVQVPIPHPQFAMTPRNEGKWLLDQEDGSDEVEEWTPVSISPSGTVERHDIQRTTET